MKDYILTTLENSRKYTLAVANAVPENSYSHKITPDTWNFGELLNHIGYGIVWWENNCIKNIPMEWTPPKLPQSKNNVITYLTKVYGDLKNTLEDLDIGEEETKGFFSTLDHITHHRGQAVLHLRSMGIAPPNYDY